MNIQGRQLQRFAPNYLNVTFERPTSVENMSFRLYQTLNSTSFSFATTVHPWLKKATLLSAPTAPLLLHFTMNYMEMVQRKFALSWVSYFKFYAEPRARSQCDIYCLYPRSEYINARMVKPGN
jgi:hypothetical protein